MTAIVEKTTISSAKIACFLAAFIIVFMIAIAAIIFTNLEKFEGFSDNIKYNNETIKNVILGGKYYSAISPSRSINSEFEKLDKSNKVGLVAILAPWCGYCKRLKESGELKKVAAKFPVLVMDDKHPQVKTLMNTMGSEGFPALGIYSSGQLMPYKNERTASDIIDVMSSINTPGKTTNVTGQIIKLNPSISLAEYNSKIKEMSGKNKVVTAFLADWCGHCKTLKASKILEKLASSGVVVLMADDKHSITSEMNITGFPSLYCVRNGKNVSYDGDRSAGAIIEFCK